MNDEQRVKEVYPDAHIEFVLSFLTYVVVSGVVSLSMQCASRKEAWADAASRLPKAQEAAPHDPYAEVTCGFTWGTSHIHFGEHCCPQLLNEHSGVHTCNQCDVELSLEALLSPLQLSESKVAPALAASVKEEGETPQTFDSTLDRLMEMLDRSQARCANSSHPCVHAHIDIKALRAAWNAAKASSPAVVGGESEYQRGFNDCREQAMRIVDESDGYLSRIEALQPLIKDVRREKP